MSMQDDFMLWLLEDDLAVAAVYTKITGTACPCMTSRDSNNPAYSYQYHIDNSGAEDCEGTGLIDPGKTTTNTNIKAVICPPHLAGNMIPSFKEIATEVGEIQKDDLFFWGTVDTSDGSFVDMSGNDEYSAYVTYDSLKYLIRDVSDIPALNGQAGRLVRKAT